MYFGDLLKITNVIDILILKKKENSSLKKRLPMTIIY